MIRRVVQWVATNYDSENLQVITVFEEGINKQAAKNQTPFCRRHRVLYKSKGGNKYEFK
ncbi:hypothetical protein HOO54_23695 [Bacillus sp. WMMC1349]|uniref:hypothetical protein n=1 Tax=Bacillus sp. WMMC1349 TaxID=2736254 RepID=UPI00155537AE|nr:hypothetical protein [Bacillus sp. WMMC1349]NPC91002.1 hypothetical protein [Bacillus sp. WMMC1349]NPC91047.1 hypothetical protein [Bacillus sp. WMMC1349]NPC94986.1 hypothetical protein [Bacillus sp. WMMC1349]NPC95026.1 hypothetical protein [Bacillus sp. WMMC1349]NPC95060.1 hypothetical protein [Bacillus sp. WMMC1349]